MQYHYVVFYDTDKRKWSFCYDSDAYFPDGHVWDDRLADELGDGWRLPEVGPEDGLDEQLLNTLYSLVDIIRIPKEHESV